MPRNRRIFVFSLPERGRISGSVLYRANARRSSMSRAEDVWIVTPAEDCRSTWNRGQRALISDGFELEPCAPDLWPAYQDDPAFDHLKRLSVELEGKVKTSIIHEESLLGLVEPPDAPLQEAETQRDGAR